MTVQSRAIEATDRLIMEESPFLQEISMAKLSEAVEEAIPLDATGNAFRMMTAADIAKVMTISVQLREKPNSDKARWESVHSVLIYLFKTRRAKCVRSCKNAIDQVVRLAEPLANGEGTSGLPVKKKVKTGGFPCPPKSKRSERHRSLGNAAAVSSGGKRSVEVIRLVRRGYPKSDSEIEDSKAASTETCQSDEEWVVSLTEVELSEFKELFPFYKESPTKELEWDFPDHPLFLPYYAAVCNEMNVRKPVPQNRIGPINVNDGNAAQYKPLASVVSNRHGAVVEVRGPSPRFEAFIASQVRALYTQVQILLLIAKVCSSTSSTSTTLPMTTGE